MRTNWDVRKAMAALDIEAVPFDDKFAEMARGYSFKRTLTIRPGERYPVFIALHEMAHVVLGHTGPKPRALIQVPLVEALMTTGNEVEAQAVALALAGILDLEDGVDMDLAHEVHYLETFFENAPHMTADSVMAKVATAAPTILRAGL